MKATKKLIKELKAQLVKTIMNKMASEDGYDTIVCYVAGDVDELVFEILWVNKDTEYIPSHWKAGIYNSASFRFGQDLSRIDFASEEAKRKIRDMFPGQEDFITWAWYN